MKLFHQTIDTLIELNKQHRKTVSDDIKYSLSLPDYTKEYGTVKCDIGRRTGKTEYINRNADEHSLVVVVNKEQKQLYRQDEFEVLTARQVINKGDDLKEYLTIYIDEPTFVFKQASEDDLYDVLCTAPDRQTFVQLGV